MVCRKSRRAHAGALLSRRWSDGVEVRVLVRVLCRYRLVFMLSRTVPSVPVKLA